jgi:hypothetical protein
MHIATIDAIEIVSNNMWLLLTIDFFEYPGCMYVILMRINFCQSLMSQIVYSYGTSSDA